MLSSQNRRKKKGKEKEEADWELLPDDNKLTQISWEQAGSALWQMGVFTALLLRDAGKPFGIIENTNHKKGL